MASRAWSKRVAGPVVVGSALPTLLYTVPAGWSGMLRFITLTNPSAAQSVTARVGLNDMVVAANRIYRVTLAPEANALVDLRVGLNAGDQLTLSTLSSVACVVTMTAFLFDS